MRVLITGISGFEGRWLARHLAERGDDVHGTLKPGHEPQAADLEGVTLHEADIRDQSRLETILEDVRPERIHHLAASSNVPRGDREAEETYDVNVTGTLHLFDAVRRKAREARFLMVGSGTAYGASAEAEDLIYEDLPLMPVSQYAISKMCCELMAREFAEKYGLDVVIVRPFNHTGPGQDPTFVCSEFAKNAAAIALGLQPPRVVVGNIDLVRDFTDVRDAVRAYHLALDSGQKSGIYNVCSGVGRLLSDILEAFLARCGREVEVERAEERFRGSDFARMVGANDRIREATGWRPEIPFERTLDDLFEHWTKELSSRG